MELVGTPSWQEDDGATEAVRPFLMRIAAHYLVNEKQRQRGDEEVGPCQPPRPLDGVARFHVRNGAELEGLNYLADPSRRGMRNSCGIMANYRYRLDAIEANQLTIARRRYALPEGAAALALVVAPPDHCGSPTCA